MATTELPDVGGRQMTPQEVEQVLGTRSTGVLSLADGDRSYAVPMSFGFVPPNRLYLAVLKPGAENEKERFLAATDLATFTVYETDESDTDGWASVVVRGPVRAATDEEWTEGVDAIDENAWHPSTFAASSPTRGIEGRLLVADAITGRCGAAFEPASR